ncbi:hypothetical protein DFH06DRAFT_107383 [Mycena polygramma]|nr:hypothetical protein DFH06DRAFT_107383 [Mycena polygramma]
MYLSLSRALRLYPLALLLLPFLLAMALNGESDTPDDLVRVSLAPVRDEGSSSVGSLSSPPPASIEFAMPRRSRSSALISHSRSPSPSPAALTQLRTQFDYLPSHISSLMPASGDPTASIQPSLSAQRHFFPNANNFTVQGGQYYSGDVHNYHTPPQPVSPPLRDLLDDTSSDAEVYCSQLRCRGRGSPIYVPGPQDHDPAEYQVRGIDIGDVGRITAEGTFDFFFNIYLPADHPINNNHVPNNFIPLQGYAPDDVFDLLYDAGEVSTASVQRLDVEESAQDHYFFGCQAPQGAVLALPHGSRLKKLENLERVQEYATAHAQSWFEYVNGPRGRRLGSGPLYVVTGYEKPPSWGMALFHSINEDFELTFKPTLPPNPSAPYRWTGNPCRKKSYAPPGGSLNQTTFIHGLSVSLGRAALKRSFSTVKIGKIPGSYVGNPGGNSTSPTRQSSWSSWVINRFKGSSGGSGTHHVWQDELSDFSYKIHPGHLINDYIRREAPQATVVMSHDDIWGSILTDNHMIHMDQFQQRLSEQYQISEKDGAAFLQSRSEISGNQPLWIVTRTSSRAELWRSRRIRWSGLVRGL